MLPNQRSAYMPWRKTESSRIASIGSMSGNRCTRWNIYKIAATAVRLGTVEAPDAATAIEKAAAEFRVPANRLMAIQR
jgi:hypothetical protein